MVFARNLVGSRDLIWSWTRRTIQGRYQQSALGWLWAVIQPAATVVIFSIIFTLVVPVNTGNIPYVVFSYVAVTPWTFLATSLTDMSGSLVQNMTLVTKIYFPREALPIAAMIARMMDFGIAAVLLLLLIIYFKMPVYLPGLLFIPLILAVQIMLTLGIGLTAAALNVFFRDVGKLVGVVTLFWFWMTPIVYPVTVVPEKARDLILLFNPLAPLVTAYQELMLYGRLPSPLLTYWPQATVALVLVIAGFFVFVRLEGQLVDEL